MKTGIILRTFLTVMATWVVASGCAPRSAATPNAGTSNQVVADLSKLRSATDRFHQLDSAVAVGYPREVANCLVHEHHGAMGYHHVNQGYLSRDVEIEKPQVLLYERLPDSSYRLIGVEFIIPYRFWPRDSVAPVLMRQKLHNEDNLKFWYLHVWAGGTIRTGRSPTSIPV